MTAVMHLTRSELRSIATILCAASLVAGCSGLSEGARVSPPPAIPSAVADAKIEVIRLSGFPLDRSLAGFVSYPKLDAVVVVSGVSIGPARWTTSDGQPPAYISENRAATADEINTFYTIITPITATVVRAIKGPFAAGTTITVNLPGGRVANYQVDASNDLGPSLIDVAMAKQMLVAGQPFDSAIEPAFLYTVDPTTRRATSLLASASDRDPSFGIDEAVRALVARP